MSTIQTFPLSALTLSPLNQRQVRDPARVQDLIPTIRSVGLKQNLCVTVEGKKKQRVGVVAGGRRLLALQLLAQAGELPADHPVNCEVIDVKQAIEISLAENSQREQMTPIEELRAFAKLHDSNMPVEDIAARFGHTPLLVQRRLRLACISPVLLDEAEAGNITLEQLMALSVVTDHAQQEECWNSAHGYERQPGHLRARLLGQTPRADQDARMKAIGIEAYTQAGGTLTRDLFADHPGYIDNEDLLDRLVAERLQAAADSIKAQGWTPEILEGTPNQYNAGGGLHQMRHSIRTMTADEQIEREAIEKRIETAGAKLEAIHAQVEADGEDEDESGDIIEAAEQEVQDADDALEAFDAKLECYSEEQMAQGLALIFVAAHGEICIKTGYTRNRPRQALNGADDDDTDVGGQSTSKQATRFHSDRLALVLSSERSVAMQASLVLDPTLALLASLDTMVQQVILNDLCYDRTVKISATSSTRAYTELLTDPENTEALNIVQAALNSWNERIQQYLGENEEGQVFDWLLTLTPEERLALNAVCVAVTFDARQHQDYLARSTPVTRHAGLSMNRWWKPTAKRYFTHLSKGQILTVLTEAGINTEGLAKLKKKDIAEKAEELMANSDWLPTPLRA